MGVLFKDIQVGDEFYKIRNGKKTHYEKCKVLQINGPDYIVYKIKGRSKNKAKWFRNRNIILYRTEFFRTKNDLLLYIHNLLTGITSYHKSDFSLQIIKELEKFRKNKPQYLI